MTIDDTAITDKQQKVWSLGDDGRVGSLLSWIGEALVRPRATGRSPPR